MTRQRDSQRQKLYNAEQVVRPVHQGKRFETVEEISAYLETARQHKWWKTQFGAFPYQPFRVRPGFGARHAHGGGTTITLPIWARTELVIWHEIAHCITQWKYPSRAAHGREYAQIFLSLIRHYLGQAAHDALKAAFRTYHVRYTPKRVLRPDVLAALRERGRLLAAARTKPEDE